MNPLIEKYVKELVSYMQKLKTTDVPLGDENEQRAYNQGWDCATDYAAGRMKSSLIAFEEKLGEEIAEEINKEIVSLEEIKKYEGKEVDLILGGNAGMRCAIAIVDNLTHSSTKK